MAADGSYLTGRPSWDNPKTFRLLREAAWDPTPILAFARHAATIVSAHACSSSSEVFRTRSKDSGSVASQ